MLLGDIGKGSPDQPRDERGRFGSGGADKATDKANEATKNAGSDKARNTQAANAHSRAMMENMKAAINARDAKASAATIKAFKDQAAHHQKMSDLHEAIATGRPTRRTSTTATHGGYLD